MPGPSLVAILREAPACSCACHETLTIAERTQGIAALYRFDDAMHGWGYRPDYTIGADARFRAAQGRADPRDRVIQVRDDACVYRRLVGFAVHEILHALVGDPTQANHGLPWGLPYGVPAELSPTEEHAYLDRYNRQEAIAFVGVAPLARALFDIDWAVYTARDVGTYGLAGGWSVVDVPPGYRPVPHVDRVNQPSKYLARARKLEDEARAWLDDARLAELIARFEEVEARGRRGARPAPATLATKLPRENPFA